MNISVAEREEIQEHRPKMNYAGYNDSWITVEIDDRYAGSWSWGQGPYYEWCDDNCTDSYNIVKYSRDTIYGRFKSEKDATMFTLRWL